VTTNPPFLTSKLLSHNKITHGFFGREGGTSTGIYNSLNVGLGSKDEPIAVNENRSRCTTALNCAPDSLITLYQVHSSSVVTVNKSNIDGWANAAPEADAMVTTAPGVMLGVLAADCMPWLFADPEASVIGAAHAGWRGALGGVLEATINAMVANGAKRQNIKATVGPALRQRNFEVGLDLVNAFKEKFPDANRFFAPGQISEKFQFDLVGYGKWRAKDCGVTQIEDLDICTLDKPQAYFSYRQSKHNNESDYGRNLSAICLSK